jgi:serine/threonine protein phosphatase 1
MTEGRTVAVGDVHDCPAALVRAIDPTPPDTLVFLGDYLDRGPDSRGVLEQVMGLAERCVVVPLRGNHEGMVLAALEGPCQEVRGGLSDRPEAGGRRRPTWR